ncbi:GCD14 domain-containing protein, partial [Cephalotus follicularis]
SNKCQGFSLLCFLPKEARSLLLCVLQDSLSNQLAKTHLSLSLPLISASQFKQLASNFSYSLYINKLSTLGMLATDPTKKISFTRCIRDGDLVVVYERYDTMKAVKVCESSVLQNRFGVFKHSDWIGRPFGTKVLSNKVLESGTGSGSLTTSLARAVAPTGHVYTFDFHEQRAASAREDFEKIGVSHLVTVGIRDVQGEGFPDEFSGKADSVFLDLPQPWLAIPSAGKMLKPDGILCSFSPCVEQVQRSCETLRSSFTDIRTFEVLLRTYEIREEKIIRFQCDEGGSPVSHPSKRKQHPSEESNAQKNLCSPVVMARPCGEARGHTGYLTFARLRCLV